MKAFRLTSVIPPFLVALFLGFLELQCGAAENLEHPLLTAVRSGDVRLVRSLLKQGAPADIKTKQGVTPLMLAARDAASDMVELLLANGADPNVKNVYESTALVWGAGDFKSVSLLLDAGANPNVRTKRNNTPLLVAASHPDSLRTVKLLAKHGAEIRSAGRGAVTPVLRATEAGCLETVQFLLAEGCKAQSEGSRRSPLAVASNLGFESIVDLLLENGADPDREGSAANSPLHAALLGEHPIIARKLVEAGAAVNGRRSTGGVTALMLAAYVEQGDASSLRLLLEKGADPKATNERGETALGWARKRGFAALIEPLEKAGTPEGKFKRKELPNRDLSAKDRNVLLKDSIQKGIDLMQLSSDAFLANRETCVSCHQQNLPSVAISWARDRGFKVDPGSLDRMMERQAADWSKRLPRVYEMDDPVPVAPRFLGWGLLGFSALGYAADEVTEAMTWYLGKIQFPDGHWTSEFNRPPMGGNDLLCTVLAMRSLQLYPSQGRRTDVAKRVDRARDWLKRQQPSSHQDRVFKLLGLGWADVDPQELVALVDELKATQRDGGGWSQLPDLESDAWATGSALVALRIGGKIESSDAVFKNGIDYLLRTQFEDGSWYVRSRSWPFQTHFDSRFPHGKDQWISAPATAWAVMAMTLAVVPENPPAVAARGAYIGGETDGQNATTQIPAADPKPEAGEFDFAGIIKPILQRSCVNCHGGDKPKGGFKLAGGRDALLKGGKSGEPAIHPGQGAGSLLARVVADQVEDMEMPPLAMREKNPPLSEEEIKQIIAWIDAGAPWPEDLKVE